MKSSSLLQARRNSLSVWNTFSSKANFQESNLQYCIELVRKFDHENFLCTLLLPNDYQNPSFVIRAFNIEVAKVQDNVSDVSLGLARLQFWDDAIDKLYTDKVPAHPVVQEINKIEKLSKRNLRRLVSSRLSLIKNKRFLTIEELEAHSENVASCIFYLQLQVAGISDLQADHALSHIGKAQGIINVLRSVPYVPRSSPLPVNILASHKVSQEMLIRQDTSKETRDAIFQIASSAKIHLDKARSLKSKLPSSVFPLCLPSLPVHCYLERLRRVDFNLFHPQLKLTDGLLPLKLWWARFRKTY